MKIAFTTLSCPDWSFEKILEQAASLGYDGIEIRGADGEMFLPKAKPFLPENINSTMAKLKQMNIEISDLGSSCSFHELEKFEENISEGKAYIDLAQKLGVKYVRVFGNNVLDVTKTAETLELVAKGVRELCSYCEGKRVYILLETHGDFADLDNLVPVLEMVHSPYLKVLWDIAHVYKMYGKDLEEFLNKTGKFIEHTHIKDVKRIGEDFKLCRIGEGDVPIGDIVQILKERGYEGYLSLEWEKKWVPELDEPEFVIPQYIDFIKKFI